MKCKDFKNNMIYYLDGDLYPEKVKIFENHLETCIDCKNLYEIFYADYSLISEDKITESNPFFYSRLMATIENKKKLNQVVHFFSNKHLIVQFASYMIIGIFAILSGYLIANDRTQIDQESFQNQTEITDLQLFAESHNLALTEDDVYIINANELEE